MWIRKCHQCLHQHSSETEYLTNSKLIKLLFLITAKFKIQWSKEPITCLNLPSLYFLFCANRYKMSSPLPFRSLKEAFLNSFGYGDLYLTNDLLVITTLIAEHLNSLIIVSTESICDYGKAFQLVHLVKSMPSLLKRRKICRHVWYDVSLFQESLFAKQLILLATFPESEATFIPQFFIFAF